MATPKLRFKEFDGDWSAQKYKDALTIKYGKDHKLLEDGEIPVYGTGGVMRYVNQYLYDGESILIGRKGTIDQPKYVNEKFWTVDTLFYSEIKQNIYPLFIYQHALQVNWLGLNEATGVPSLNTTSINNVDIYLPSKEEQTKIASFLSNVDEKISQLTQKHELLSQYKQGMMQKLFSQQLRFKVDDGSEFEEWDEKILSELFDYANGKSFEAEVIENGSFKLITLNSIDIKGNLKNSHKTISQGDNSLLRNDLIMILSDVAHGNFLGLTAIIPDNSFVLNQRVGRLRSKTDINICYMRFYINFNQKYFKLNGQGSSQLNLSKGDVLSFPVNLPCLEEQTKIANFLSSIDQKIEVVAQQIEQAKQWKKGLLQQMFV